MRHRRTRARSGLLAGLIATAAVAVPGAAVAAAAADPEQIPQADVVAIAADMPPGVLPGPVLVPRPKPKAVAFVLPVRGYHLTGRFGDISGLWRTVHTGLDFAAPTGTPIRAVAKGVVVSTGYDGSYGNKTIVRLSTGTELWYCHQSAYKVKPGDKVKPGQLIGLVGATGNTTGPHLHLEVRPSPTDPIDPDSWLAMHHLNA